MTDVVLERQLRSGPRPRRVARTLLQLKVDEVMALREQRSLGRAVSDAPRKGALELLVPRGKEEEWSPSGHAAHDESHRLAQLDTVTRFFPAPCR